MLHVGSHKTGTTTIQHVLASSREHLKASGIYYPDPKPFFGRQTVAHHELAHTLAGRSSSARYAAERFRSHLRDVAHSYDRILLSAEPFYRHISTDSEDAAEIVSEDASERSSEDEIWARREQYIRGVTRFFDGFDVEVLLYLRRTDNFAESLYKSAVVSTPYRGGFEKYISRRTFRFDYQKQTSLFESNFGKLTLLSYEQSLRQGLAPSFFGALGIQEPPAVDGGEDDRLRTSPSGKAILWIDRLKQNGNLSKKGVQRRWHFSLLPASGFSTEAKSTFWSSIDRRDDFLKQYSAPDLVDFFPPVEAALPSLPTLDEREFDALNARFLEWERENSSYLLRRERLSIPAYKLEEPPSPSGTSIAKHANADGKMTVAICCITRHRPKMLAELLESWSRLRFPSQVLPVFVVVENDERGISEKRVLDARPGLAAGELIYRIEPEVGIPYARNAAIDAALRCEAKLIAFVDDDETVSEDWFLKLYETYRETGAQLIGGPVRASFKHVPKGPGGRMVMRGIAARYKRVERKALSRLDQGNASRVAVLTNNWLAEADLFTKLGLSFDRSLRYTGGSDTKFFRDAVAKGVRTSWSPEALVFETIPPERTSLSYQFERGKEQSKTSVRAKIAAHGRVPVLPMMMVSIGVRSAGAFLQFVAAPFTRGQTLVGCARTCGWIAGRVGGFLGRESGLYKRTTGD